MNPKNVVDYDPYSHEAMKDPSLLYKAMRDKEGPHFVEKYNAWALARFEDVWEASMSHEKDVTFTEGQSPGQVLLGEPVFEAFSTMDAPEHRKWRSIVRKDYNPEGASLQKEGFREIVKETLGDLLVFDQFDIYSDYANKVFCINSGNQLGLPKKDSIYFRSLIDEMLHREAGQQGMSSQRNQQAVSKLIKCLTEYVVKIRANPKLASGHTKAYMDAEVDNRKLDDEELLFIMVNFLILGSETTPMVCAGMLYYLAQNPKLKSQVMADHSLISKLYSETCRFDQPTNMLCRVAINDFELHGAQIEKGQKLMYIYASANRDGAEFERPDEFDIFRTHKRDLTYGAGGHKCLGMHLATMGAEILISELFSKIEDYELVEGESVRAYGEFLSGFMKVPIRVKLK